MSASAAWRIAEAVFEVPLTLSAVSHLEAQMSAAPLRGLDTNSYGTSRTAPAQHFWLHRRWKHQPQEGMKKRVA